MEARSDHMNSTIHDLEKVGLAVKNAILPAAMSTCVSEPGVVFQNVNYIRVASIVIIEGPLSGYGIGVILPHTFQALGWSSIVVYVIENDL